MLNEVASIVESFETLDMSPSQIAEDRGMDIVAVKAALSQSSKKYRALVAGSNQEGEAAEKDPTLDFDNDDLRTANEVIRHLAKHGEDEHLRLKAAMYIRDDKKGRKEVVKVVGSNQFNIFQFNEQLRAAREGAARLKEGFIDVAAA